MYECGNRSLILREEGRQRVFEKRVLRKIFGPRRNKVTEECRRIHNELNDVYASSNIIWVFKSRRMRWVGAYSTYGAERCIQGFGGES